MGKNLKGKECGKGIYQRKDGLFSARYYAKDGKRKEKYFETLPEAKNWLADARYEERHNLIVTSPDMTVDKWFTYWIENIVCDLAPNTIRNYKERSAASKNFSCSSTVKYLISSTARTGFV